MINVAKKLRGLNARIRGIAFRVRHMSATRNCSGTLVLSPKCACSIDRTALIDVNGKLVVGANYIPRSGRSSMVRMDARSILRVRGTFTIFYDSDIIVFKGGVLSVGDKSFINSNCKIRCHSSISIGDGCAISHDVTIMDSDAHFLNGSKNTCPVSIGDHVWIGTRVTILSGVTVGSGAVIAAGALVSSDVPSGCLVGGVPAKVLKENITWEK